MSKEPAKNFIDEIVALICKREIGRRSVDVMTQEAATVAVPIVRNGEN